MKTWRRALKDGMVAGTVAGLASLAALAVRGRMEGKSPWGPVNAPSHWVWGNRALRQDEPRARYTVTALLVHQLAAGFWGVLHEKFLGIRGKPKASGTLLRDAAATTTVAAVVDLVLVPHRLTPGFQDRLSPRSLVAVYSLFALGLALGSHAAGRR
jgi:hypothetical protein